VSATFEEVPRRMTFAQRWARSREAVLIFAYQKLLWLYFLWRRWQP
jgi:hypothetical protein